MDTLIKIEAETHLTPVGRRMLGSHPFTPHLPMGGAVSVDAIDEWDERDPFGPPGAAGRGLTKAEKRMAEDDARWERGE